MNKFFLSSLLIIACFTVCICDTQFLGIKTQTELDILLSQGYVRHPFGLSHRDCILTVPNKARVEEIVVTENKKVVAITYEDGSQKIIEEQCPHKRYSLKPQATATQGQELKDWPGHTWFGVQQHFEKQIKNFSSTYIVPNNPTDDDGQSLFYWIGMYTKVNVHTVNVENSTVIQPVLSYAGSGSWTFQSWNCCPGGYTWNSPEVDGISSGDKITGYIALTEDPMVYQIVSDFNGQQSSLTANLNNMTDFEGLWAVVVLETYSIGECNEYPAGPATFQDIKVETVDGSAATLDWQYYDEYNYTVNCGGSYNVTNGGSQVAITYTQAQAQQE